MNDRLRRLLRSKTFRQWAMSIGLTAAGMLLLGLPAWLHVSASRRSLEKMRATYAVKMRWVEDKAGLAQRVREAERAVAELESKLLTDTNVPKFTQAVAFAARAAGCRVASIRPLEPRVLPRPDEKEPKEGPRGPKRESRVQFVQSPVQMSLRGEYGQLCALLGRLSSEKWLLHLTRFTLQPEGEDQVNLSCSLEVAGYGLKTLPEEK